MKYFRKMTLMLMILTLFLPITFLNAIQIQQHSDPKLKAEALLILVDFAKKSIEESLERINNAGKNIPLEAENKYSIGNSLAEESYTLLEKENYSEASIVILNTLQIYREVLLILEDFYPINTISTELKAYESICLKAAINRISEYAERLENLAIQAELLGYNSTVIRITIDFAKQYIIRSKNHLETGMIDKASEDLIIVKTLLNDSNINQKILTSKIMTNKTMEYLTKTEIRLFILRANITSLSTEIPQEVKNASLTALIDAEYNLQNAITFMSEGKVEETLYELVKLRENEEISRMHLMSVAETIQELDKNDSL